MHSYPKMYHDKLNRLAYVLENEFEKTIYTFYGQSNKIKVKYKFYRQDVKFDVFTESGYLLLSNFSERDVKFKKTPYGTIKFTIHPNKLKKINNLK